MTGLFTRAVVLFVTLGVMSAGPVAACVCDDGQADQHLDDAAANHMASMPCCPEEPQDAEPSHDAWSDFGSYAAVCDPVPAEVLPASARDVPAHISMPVVAWAWPARGPPETAESAYLEPDQAPAVYLVTRRLRI